MKTLNTIKVAATIAVLFSISIFTVSLTKPDVGELKVIVTGVKNSNGEINFNLFDKSEGFPKVETKALKHLRGKISNGISTVTFDKVKFGHYAVAVYHDENNNKKLDKNFFGRPIEGASVSNNARGSISGPPSFKAAEFEVNATSQNITITMDYDH